MKRLLVALALFTIIVPPWFDRSEAFCRKSEEWTRVHSWYCLPHHAGGGVA